MAISQAHGHQSAAMDGLSNTTFKSGFLEKKQWNQKEATRWAPTTQSSSPCWVKLPLWSLGFLRNLQIMSRTREHLARGNVGFLRSFFVTIHFKWMWGEVAGKWEGGMHCFPSLIQHCWVTSKFLELPLPSVALIRNYTLESGSQEGLLNICHTRNPQLRHHKKMCEVTSESKPPKSSIQALCFQERECEITKSTSC